MLLHLQVRNWGHQKRSNFIRSLSPQVSTQDKTQGLSDPKVNYPSEVFRALVSEQSSPGWPTGSLRAFLASLQSRGPLFTSPSLLTPLPGWPMSATLFLNSQVCVLLFPTRIALPSPPNTSNTVFASKPSSHHHHEASPYLFHFENAHYLGLDASLPESEVLALCAEC